MALTNRTTTVIKILSSQYKPHLYGAAFFIMVRLITIISTLLLCQSLFAQNEWYGFKISGAVKVYLPGTPSLIDTLDQQYAYVRVKEEMMMCSVVAIPDSVLNSDTFQIQQVLDNFTNSIITGSTRLIYTDVDYKGVDAKYFKVRMDDERNPLFGLIVDGYSFSLADTLYSLSYWRFKPSDLFDYSQQRTFYDKVEISLPVASESNGKIDSEVEITDFQTDVGLNMKDYILIGLVIVLSIAVVFLVLKRTGKSRNE